MRSIKSGLQRFNGGRLISLEFVIHSYLSSIPQIQFEGKFSELFPPPKLFLDFHSHHPLQKNGLSHQGRRIERSWNHK